tara:strand:+ start:3996 stop:4157 length:162 start_codon:yes stop_codon:yes gene_type:complete
MPTPFMCHGCDLPTMSPSGICNRCAKVLAEPTTADEYNKKWLKKKKKNKWQNS